MSSHRVTVGDTEYVIEEFRGRKALRAITLLKHIARRMPDITTKWNDFVREYEATNMVEFDRVQAKQRFGTRPLLDEDGEPIYKKDEGGNPTEELVLAPSFLDAMTEADWEKAGHKLRIPRSPSMGEILAHLFPDIVDAAEEYVVQLLALIVMKNADVKRYGRQSNDELTARLKELGDDLLDDGSVAELVELAVVGGESISEEYSNKAAQLGNRAGNALRLVGVRWNPSRREPETSPEVAETESGDSETTSSNSNSTSSNGSPTLTGGARDGSSTEPVGVSSTV